MVKSGAEICDLHNVILEEYERQQQRKLKKEPKRVLKFSDGVLEEYSSEDESDGVTEREQTSSINPKNLDWLPWAWYQTTWASGKILEGCDTVGEYLAAFLGITTPKYQFEIDEYHRIKAAKEDMQRKEDLEMGGWVQRSKSNLIEKNES